MVTTAIFSGADPLFADLGGMVFQSDGKIVVAGKVWPDAKSAKRRSPWPDMNRKVGELAHTKCARRQSR